MGKRFIVTCVADVGQEAILGHDVRSEDVFPIVVDDALASDIFSNVEGEARKTAIEMAAIMVGLSDPRDQVEGRVRNRTYRVEELPDDPVARDEFLTAKLAKAAILYLVYRTPGSLRIEIWPNESQHRGRPHCRVSAKGKAATFTLPEGELLTGNLNPDEAKARKLVQLHGEELLDLWHRMRPDDQKL